MRTLIITFVGLFLVLSGGSLFAQHDWSTLPVFHNGRVMPMNTYAQQVVREICGKARPFIIQDDAVISEFSLFSGKQQDTTKQDSVTSGPRFLNPSGGFLDGGFNREYSPFDVASETQGHVQITLPIQGLDPVHVQRLLNRIRQLIPAEGRYFQADELVFSWICEPEVWTYIPIFLVPEMNYLEEMFDVNYKDDARTSQYRISLYQLENSQRYKQRCADIQRRRELGQINKNPVPFDQITERLEKQAQLFRDLTFHPQRYRPLRMLSLLYHTAGTTEEQSSFATAMDTWGYLLALGEVPERQSIDRPVGPNDLIVSHPTTLRWHEIDDILRRLILSYSRVVLPNASVVEQLFEKLIDRLDANLAESAALMESVYPGVSYRRAEDSREVNLARLLPRLQLPDDSPQKQQMVRQLGLRYYYSVKKMRNEIEIAYLALYDNGRAVRFLPFRSPLVMEMASSQNDFGVQPWASAQMVLGSGETFVKRFFDPQLEISPAMQATMREQFKTADTPIFPIFGETDGINEDGLLGTTDEEKGEPDVPEDSSADEKIVPPAQSEMEQLFDQLFQPHDTVDGILLMGSSTHGSVAKIRQSMRTWIGSFPLPGSEYQSSSFNLHAQQVQEEVRQVAVQIDSYRKSLVDEKNSSMNELLIKTTYPSSLKKIWAEYRYSRWHLFFWMGVFALFAALLNGVAHMTAAARRKSSAVKTVSIHSTVQGGKKEQIELPDYTNSIEEWLHISSTVMLMLSILIAFIGGVMRAGITGWAPVTNMSETIVLMTFSTAVFGVWYSLYPLLQPAFKQAWIYSKFPQISTLREWFSAVNTHKSAHAHETSGEAAMREAAMEFGVPGGLTFGGHYGPTSQNQTSVESETQLLVGVAQRKMMGQCLFALPRLLLMLLVFYAIVLLANGDYAAEQGFFPAALNMFATNDVIDLLVVAASVLLMIGFVPHVLLTLLMLPVVLLRPDWIAAERGIRSFEERIVVESSAHQTPPNLRQPTSAIGRSRTEMSGVFHGEVSDALDSQRNTSGTAWLKQARNAILDRKMFIAISASIVFAVSLLAIWNRTEFNPDIRPIAAVLRSNFWLVVHVTAIVVSYAAAFVAWGIAVVSLGYVIFGRYQRVEQDFIGQKRQVMLPEECRLFSSIIDRLIRIALLLLIAGTVLGARWADYSWGRFWSWDPKEVWALITILFYVIVCHGKIARYYGTIGITIGVLFAVIAVVTTWYGVNFILTGSIHAYGGGTTSNATFFFVAFIAANLLWGALALLRYYAEVYGSDTETTV